MRFLRKNAAAFLKHNLFVGIDEGFEMITGQPGVIEHATAKLQLFEGILKQAVIDLHHHIGIHLDEAAVAVIGKAFVIGPSGKSGDGGVVQAEIQDRVHHSRHRGTRAGPHRDQKRVFRIGKPGPGFGLDPGNGIRHLTGERIRIGAAIVVILGADLGGDGKARWHREPDTAHLGEVRALAAKKIAHTGIAISAFGTKAVDPFCRRVVHDPLSLQFREIRDPLHAASHHSQKAKTILAHRRVIVIYNDAVEEPVNRPPQPTKRLHGGEERLPVLVAS